MYGKVPSKSLYKGRPGDSSCNSRLDPRGGSAPHSSSSSLMAMGGSTPPSSSTQYPTRGGQPGIALR